MKHLTIDWVSRIRQPLLPQVLCTVFLLGWGVETVSFFFRQIEPPLPIKESVKLPDKRPIPIEQTLNAPLFGRYALPDEELTEASSVQAEVVGILYASDPSESQVIIRIPGREEKSYRAGDTLPGNLVIRRILRDSIVILHRGKLESLGLPKNPLRFEPLAKPIEE